MAIDKLSILNPSDKTRHYSYASGEGAPAATDVLVTDTHLYPVGSQYLDTAGGTLYVRISASVPPVVADWKAV